DVEPSLDAAGPAAGADLSPPPTEAPGAADPAPPPPVARAAVPRLGAATPTPPPRPAPAPPKKSGGGGKLVVALVALVVIGVVVVGGGLAVAWSMGLFGSGGGQVAEPIEVPPPVETADRGAPGGRIEVGPMDGSNGALVLALEPAGSAAVSLSSVTGFKQDWDGTGRLELVGLSPGTYKTKVAPATGSALRGTLEVKAGQTCSYVFPTTGGESEWTAQGCE
ncbi:hypothetical protein L6R53_31725, partial [Myxococcota bacterium]|nr:hypothetical protein [Myxococcota bacterium]